MQVVTYGQRVLDPEHGPGRVVEIIFTARRGLPGGSCVEALVSFDDGIVRAVCVEDLAAEEDCNGSAWPRS